MDRRQVLAAAAAGLAARLIPGCGVRVAGTVDAAQLPQEIPPITPTGELYVYQCCGTPEVDLVDWSMSVRIAGEVVATLTPPLLASLGAQPWEQTLQCIGADENSPQIGNAVWGGRPLREVLDALGVQVPPSAIELVPTGTDGFHTALPISDLDAPVWLIWELDGAALPLEHGGPIRLIVPNRYGMKNPKWLMDIDLVDEPHVGYWEFYNWSNEATYQPTSFILSPLDGQLVSGGPVRLLGVGYAGADPVVRIELSTDGGATWQDAELDYAPGANVWVTWHLDWVPERTGEYTVKVRTTTASGATSTATSSGEDPMDGYDGSMEIGVRIV